MLKFIEAVLILSGMIIGVGMFAIPFSLAASGFWLGALELFILASVVTLLHLLYSEVVLKTGELHRLPGYAAIYLGGRTKILARFSALFGISGTLLAYIVVGSIFLNTIFQRVFPGLAEFWWAVALMISGAAINLFPLKKEALLNGILTAFLIGFIVLLIFFLFPRISVENLAAGEFKNLFLPYGVLLFALSGGAIIPEVITVLGKDKLRVRKAILFGTLIPAVLYFFFALSVVGVAGANVSPEAISGLLPFAGENIVFLGSVIGLLAVFTSFIVLNSNFQSMLTLDFGFRSSRAWMTVSAIPPILYFLGFQNFIVIIGAVGAIAVGIDSALILASYHQLRVQEGISFFWFSYLWKAAIYMMIMAGIIFELQKSVF